MKLLAFALHTLMYVADGSYRLIRDRLTTCKTFFEHVRTLTHFECFEGWGHVMDFMMEGLEIGPYAKKD